jgi:DNA repair exonuclease SbcCD ATPase subunit
VSKHPKSTKYGRQNPISLRWNSDEQLVLWRESWAETVNQSLERNGRDERIDHRSHAARGLDEQPTVHEGVIARAMERQGIVSDRCELNRQIKADNALLRELKAQVKKLAQAVQNTVPALAEAMESLRAKMIVFRYQFRRIDVSKQQRTNHLKSLKTFLGSYTELVQQIKDKSAQRKELQAEKKATSVLHIPKQRDLNRRITELTEDLEEMRSEKTLLLQRLDDDDTDISGVKKDITTLENDLKKLEQQEAKYSTELDDALKQYKELQDRGVEFDPQELMDARLALRPVKEQAAAEQVQKAYGDQYSFTTMNDSKRDVSTMLGEAAEMRSLWECQRRIQREKERQEREQRRKPRNRDYER